MDKKKKISYRILLLLSVFCAAANSLRAQDVEQIEFCGRKYKYEIDNDSITLYLKLFDSKKEKARVNRGELYDHLRIYEGNEEKMPIDIQSLSGGLRIPQEYTFSVLVDLGINSEGKQKIYDAIGSLVQSAPDSCVYLSFFGDGNAQSKLVTAKNYDSFRDAFLREGQDKYFYSAIRSRLMEFDKDLIERHADYPFAPIISERAKANNDKVILFLFVNGTKSPDNSDPIPYYQITQNKDQINKTVWPRTFAFYYVPNGYSIDEGVASTLDGITGSSQKLALPEEKQGKYEKFDNIDDILKEFGEIQEDLSYDFAFIYKAEQSYSGKVSYSAKWDERSVGDAVLSIGAPENPWPIRNESVSDSILKYLIAFLVTFLIIAFFFCVMKILIPFIRSRIFAMKYYKPYNPEAGIKKICYYCKQPILPGQKVVTKCKHVMHVECWKQNDYRCSEYGQNCNVGIQEHVEWHDILSWHNIKDCQQAITGISAGLVSWIAYELMGRKSFTSMAEGIAHTFFTDDSRITLLGDCTTRVSAFLTIGILLGFFLSLIFRYNDEYRSKDWKIYLKIFALSILTSIIGFMAFAFGGIILCMILESSDKPFIPWYCSLPAYLLFSVCTSLSLTIKSSIPVKSAMLGGLCSTLIGFLVLYLTSASSSRYPWMNILLDFIIYGGGLGASLVTVRMLAEKYFLVITNGVKAGTRIPIHKWMNATGGGNKVSIGMTGECEIQMNWEKSNKVAKEHAVLFIDQNRQLPIIKPLATGVIFNSRAELPVRRPSILSNGDTIKIGDTIFRYEETE